MAIFPSCDADLALTSVLAPSGLDSVLGAVVAAAVGVFVFNRGWLGEGTLPCPRPLTRKLKLCCRALSAMPDGQVVSGRNG